MQMQSDCAGRHPADRFFLRAGAGPAAMQKTGERLPHPGTFPVILSTHFSSYCTVTFALISICPV